ncbi:MAG TPA: hypothetical protein VGF45_10395 [Polyangia bacterium]
MAPKSKTKPVKPAASSRKKTARAKPAATARAAAPSPPGKRTLLPKFDRAVVDRLDELFGGRAQLRKGAMFGCPGYFLGTKAVACVFGNAINLTLPPARIDELVTTPGFRRFEAHGRVMNGWVLIDQERAESLEPDDPLFEAAIANAAAKAVRSPAPGKRPPRKT